jgi:hypothetical protein
MGVREKREREKGGREGRESSERESEREQVTEKEEGNNFRLQKIIFFL